MVILSNIMEWVIGVPFAVLLWMALYLWGKHIHEAQVASQQRPARYKTSTGSPGEVAIVTPTKTEVVKIIADLSHEQWTEELVAQIEDWDADNGSMPVIAFHLDADRGDHRQVNELVLKDVHFEDGIIKATLDIAG